MKSDNVNHVFISPESKGHMGIDLSLERRDHLPNVNPTRKRARIKIPVKGDSTGGICTGEENTE